jgi:hypothetical protein
MAKAIYKSPNKMTAVEKQQILEMKKEFSCKKISEITGYSEGLINSLKPLLKVYPKMTKQEMAQNETPVFSLAVSSYKIRKHRGRNTWG